MRQIAARDKEARFTALMHHVTVGRLQVAYWALNPRAATGVDGVTWEACGQDLDAKLHQVRDELWRRRHLPVPEQGAWLGSVVRGHCAYYAVPGNSDAIREFRTQAARHWYRALRRRSQRTSLNWERMDRLATRWLPQAKISHPWPSVRFDARTQGRSPVR